MLKIKILSHGKIPGYPVNGPVIFPIWVEKEAAMRFINAGLDVRVWVEEVKQYVRFTAADMLDMYNNKNGLPSINDDNHNTNDNDCVICEDVQQMINLTRIKQESSKAHPVTKQRISSDEPVIYVVEPEPIMDEEVPDFGDAYEPTPFEAFGLDDFEEK